jgi:hypothetical protein
MDGEVYSPARNAERTDCGARSAAFCHWGGPQSGKLEGNRQGSYGARLPGVTNWTGERFAAQSSRSAQFARQHGGKNLLPVFLLAGGRLCGIEPLLQAEPGPGLTKAENAGTVRQLQEEHFDIAFHSKV